MLRGPAHRPVLVRLVLWCPGATARTMPLGVFDSSLTSRLPRRLQSLVSRSGHGHGHERGLRWRFGCAGASGRTGRSTQCCRAGAVHGWSACARRGQGLSTRARLADILKHRRLRHRRCFACASSANSAYSRDAVNHGDLLAKEQAHERYSSTFFSRCRDPIV